MAIEVADRKHNRLLLIPEIQSFNYKQQLPPQSNEFKQYNYTSYNIDYIASQVVKPLEVEVVTEKTLPFDFNSLVLASTSALKSLPPSRSSSVSSDTSRCEDPCCTEPAEPFKPFEDNDVCQNCVQNEPGSAELNTHEAYRTRLHSQRNKSIVSKESEDESLEECENPNHSNHHVKVKRQRAGPCCDYCRFKKTKCDAFIEVINKDFEYDGLKLDSNNNKVLNEELVNKYLSIEDQEDGYELMYSFKKLVKFKKCSICQQRDQHCCFYRGYTKEDIITYNLIHNIKSNIRKKYKKRRQMK